jgi:hypothetical protein
MRKLYNLTKQLNVNTLVFPGGPCFQSETISAIGINPNFALQKLQFCNHAGTHIDFPFHVIIKRIFKLCYSCCSFGVTILYTHLGCSIAQLITTVTF